MKLSVMQENLARGLSVVSRAVSNRSLPVLTNVLLKTEDAGLKLTATNLEIGITYWVPGKIETDGATSVPARLLTDLVNSLPGGEPIILELGEGETLHIRSGRFESNIKGISADDFPTVQTAGERPITRIPQKVLRQALEETAFAAASDEARPILTGVLARFEGDQLTLRRPTTTGSRKTISILVGRRTSVVIPASAPRTAPRPRRRRDPVRRTRRPESGLSTRGVDLVSRSRVSTPNYHRCAGEPYDQGDLDREELPCRPPGSAHRPDRRTSSSRRGERGDPASRSARRRVGDHIGRIEAAVEGDGTTIAFNARFLADVLTNVDAEQFALELNGPLSPGVFKPVGDDRYVHVVMPLRTTS